MFVCGALHLLLVHTINLFELPLRAEPCYNGLASGELPCGQGFALPACGGSIQEQEENSMDYAVTAREILE